MAREDAAVIVRRGKRWRAVALSCSFIVNWEALSDLELSMGSYDTYTGVYPNTHTP